MGGWRREARGVGCVRHERGGGGGCGGGESSVEGGAEDSGPESADSTFSLVKMERGFPPLKMTTLPRPRRARTWTAMAMRKGVEVRRAVRASHFFF